MSNFEEFLTDENIEIFKILYKYHKFIIYKNLNVICEDQYHQIIKYVCTLKDNTTQDTFQYIYDIFCKNNDIQKMQVLMDILINVHKTKKI
jgi:hypothetical protein